MRLWSIHPRFLDRMGLLGLWREALHAQRILLSGPPYTQHGWGNHPQMDRFKNFSREEGIGAIAYYLREIRREGRSRGYKFDGSLIHAKNPESRLEHSHYWHSIRISRAQINHELRLLLRKVELRDKNHHQKLMNMLYELRDQSYPWDSHHIFDVQEDITDSLAYWETVKKITI